MRKVFKSLLYLIAGLGILLEGTMAVLTLISHSDEDEEVDDPRNFALERRDKQGNLVSRKQKVDGEWHGHQLYRDRGGTDEGWFEHGIRVGRWTARYANGGIRCVRLYTTDMKTTSHGERERESTLLTRTDYKIDGTAIGILSNDIGVCVYMRDDGERPFEYITYGFATNVSVSFSTGVSRSPLAITSIVISEPVKKSDGFDSRVLLRCDVDDDGMITSTEERTVAGYHQAIRMEAGDEVFFQVEDRGMPPFLSGKSRYVIPSLIKCKPVFDLQISCTNNMLVVTRLPLPIPMGIVEIDRKEMTR